MKKSIYVIALSVIIGLSLGIWLDISSNHTKNSIVISDNIGFDSLNNQGIGWGLKKVKNSEPEIPKSQQDMLSRYNAFYIDPQRSKKLYLTFDEGYENGYTAQILDILNEKQVTAAFFITGPYAKNEQELVRRMIDEGHIVGNHTVNHPNLPKLASASSMANELSQMNELVEDIYSYKMTYMRPPEGEYSQRLLAVAQSLGFRTVFWSFAYKDWDVNSQKGADYAFNEVSQYLHDGAVLLLHAVSSDNAQSLSKIIDYARDKGYTFASLDEIKINNTEENSHNG